MGAAADEERKWSRRWWSRRKENTFWIVDFGKKLGLQSKKTSLTKMACWRGLLMWIQKSILANSLKTRLVWVFFFQRNTTLAVNSKKYLSPGSPLPAFLCTPHQSPSSTTIMGQLLKDHHMSMHGALWEVPPSSLKMLPGFLMKANKTIIKKTKTLWFIK